MEAHVTEAEAMPMDGVTEEKAMPMDGVYDGGDDAKGGHVRQRQRRRRQWRRDQDNGDANGWCDGSEHRADGRYV